jgi:ATP-dependent DNA ligase
MPSARSDGTAASGAVPKQRIAVLFYCRASRQSNGRLCRPILGCPLAGALCESARSLTPFDDPDWLFELKHDGFRALAYLEDGKCRLVSRHRNTYKSFETLATDLSRPQVKNAILDGDGRSQFKERLYRKGRAIFFTFDLLWLNDTDLRHSPLIERKKRLQRIIHRSHCSERNLRPTRRATWRDVV